EDCDAFDSDVDEVPTAQTMFMANLSSADPITDEAGPSYDLDILFEVQDHDQYLDDNCAYQEEHVMHDSVQLEYVVDLHADHTSISNMIQYDQPLYNDLNKVAIGYKNPLCLTRAKQAQPALYNGHEILIDNHAHAKVHNTEDTLEIAKITRKKMNAKMTDPECVTHKVKIAPHDYSKENLLATFTPQKQLTLKQIYWSNDLMKLKYKSLKERAKVSRPIKAFTVYPSNTPATLVPRVLPTTSQVKIHIFILIQQFSEFYKTCKKRITPSAITDGKRGFEQTKACYLQEVILFFQTIKENFEDRKHDAIDRKNLLIANDNLIAECLSKEVFSVATKSKLNVARFAEMHVANTSIEARCLALEAELATLRDKSHQENQREAENDKVKQHYKQLYDSIKITRTKHIKQVTKLAAKNVTLKTSVSKAKVQPSVLTQTKHAVDVELIVPRLRKNRDAHLDYLRHLKESVETICDIVEEAKVVRPLEDPLYLPAVTLSTLRNYWRVKRCPKASGSQPKSNHKTNSISLAKGSNKLPVEDLPRMNKSHPRTTNHVDSSSLLKRSFDSKMTTLVLSWVMVITWLVKASSIGKHSCYVRDANGVDLIKGSRRTNLYTIYVEDMMRKDLVRGLPRLKFEKDHRCSACQLRKSKKHTHKPKVGNTNLEVLNTLHMDLCDPMRVQTINGKKYILVIVDDYSRFTWVKFLRSKDETPEVVINIFHQKTVPKTPQQNGVVERQNRTLVEAARTMLIFTRASMFLWAEDVATACYTQNCSLIHTHHYKTPYELVHNKKPDLTFFKVFGAICYPTNDSEDLGKLQPTADTGIFVGYAPSR
nr:hypothetical protein [Tanacetum cinerariifolium]